MVTEAKKAFIINVIFISLWMAIIIFFAKFLLEYLFPFIPAVIVAYLIQKPSEVIARKIHLKKGTVAALLSAVLYIALALILGFLLARAVSLSGNIIKALSSSSIEQAINRVQELLSRFSKQMPADLRPLSEQLLSSVWSAGLSKLSAFLSDFAAGAVGRAPSFLFSSIVALIATCYIAKDYDKLCKFLRGIISKKAMKSLQRVTVILRACVFKMLSGYLIIMAITFLELSAGLFLLRVKNPFLLAGIIAVIDILPVLGVGAVLLPWGFLSLFSGNVFLGAGLIILYLLITVVRNFAEPKIVGSKTGISPLFLLLTVFLGLRLFGGVGIIILPVTFIVTVKYYKSEMGEALS